MTTSLQPSRFHRALENCTLLLTFAMRLAGLVLGVYQILLRHQNDPVPLLYASLLVLGANAFKELVFGAVDRIMEKTHESHGTREGD